MSASMTRTKTPKGGHSGPTGELPERWQMETLGKIAAGFVSGGTPSTKNNEFWKGNIPWITSKWLNFKLHLESGEKFISEDALKQSAATVVPKNNLIFATRVGVGKAAVNNIDLAINQDLAGVLVDSHRHDIRFLAYQLRSDRIQRTVASQKRGATIQGITRDALKELEIYLPPLTEQRKIAGVLGLVQRAIEQQERLIALTTELKKTLLHKLFTEGLHGEPQKQTEIGPVPKSWGVVQLESVFHTQLGKMLSQKARTGNAPKPYLRNKNVQWGAIDTTDLLSMDFNERECEKFALVPGDLLICEGGEPGRAAIWHGELKECYYQKALHRLRPKSDTISNEFLAHWLEFALRYQDLYGVAGASSTIAHLPEVQLKMLQVPLPIRNEQETIVEVLKAVENKIALHKSKHAALTALFRTMLHQLMNSQLRVNDLNFPQLPERMDEYGDSCVIYGQS